MKAIAKYVVLVLLVVCFVSATIGLHVAQHHCNMSGNTTYAISFENSNTHSSSNCCCVKAIAVEDGCCSLTEVTFNSYLNEHIDGCCSNKNQVIEIIDDYIPAEANNLNFEFSSFIPIIRLITDDFFQYSTERISLAEGLAPPGRVSPRLSIFTCCFLL